MIGKEEMGRQELLALLHREFLLDTNGWTENQEQKARQSLCRYDSLETFLADTGWKRDNPELCSEEYLTHNRICRRIDGQVYYFSRILWEGGEQG